ncbi:hypothetical protein BGX28_003266 [Mortierella sp. GBA30]|nr:hypothetical protein BGX28_003266 [Mortierella sp. GBA30]
MWNDPDLDSHRNQSSSSTSAANDHRSRASKDDISAFGYECFLFDNDGVADAIEQGQLLITWQGQDPADENALWLDRYDVRNLLDDERLFSGHRDIYDLHFLSETLDLDQERFEDLDSDEELLFDMDEDERKEHLENKHENKNYQYKGAHYEYDKEGPGSVQDSTFHLHFDVPEGMAVPDSEKSLALIERTAKFVNNSSEPTMEIILQAKQATNPNFAFMSRRHHLFQFYKHVRWLMQTGLYESLEDSKRREAEEATVEEEETRKATEAADAKDKDEPRLHVDTEKVIEKMIGFLSAYEDMPIFEERILSQNDPKFHFMMPDDPWYGYYKLKRDESRKSSSELDDHGDPHLSESNSAGGARFGKVNASVKVKVKIEVRFT